MSFDSLGLDPELVRVVADQGYTEPTPVQLQSIPYILAGRDLLAGAQTGTGKTAAFVLPILQILHRTRPAGSADPAAPRDRRDATRPPIRTLVLTPTRELALQVEESVRTYGARRPIRSTTIYGGVGFDPQVRALRNGPEIVVATPGRLLDHMNQRTIDLSRVEILVLDEADRMLDMGFIRDIRKVIAALPARRQNLLFSATFSEEIRGLASGILVDPAAVQVAPRNASAELVRQVVIRVDRERKRELLSHLVTSGRIDQALVFTRTKHGANRLAQQLERDGISASAIHGNKSQSQRVRALADFKAGRFAILVATEIAARGLDIDALPHVVNFELPMVPEDYVHRIGRTGRAGMDGDAVSLVCVDEHRLLADIERVLGRPIPSEVVPGFEPDPSIRPEPILQRSAGGRSVGGRGAPAGRGVPGERGGQRPIAPVGRASERVGREAGPRPAHAGARPAGGAPSPAGGPGGPDQGRSRGASGGGGRGFAGPRRSDGGPRRPDGSRPSGGRPMNGTSVGRPMPAPSGRPSQAHGGRPSDGRGNAPTGPGRGQERPREPQALPGERLARAAGGPPADRRR
jgi:ATP-dependent RNA helicase RhlE